MSWNIGIAMSNQQHMELMQKVLLQNGYKLSFMVSDGNECIRKSRATFTDVVIIDFILPGIAGYDVANILSNDKISVPILLVNESQKSIIDKKKLGWELICLVKPFKVDVVLNTIEMQIKNAKKIKALEKEINELKNQLEVRKNVEKAKNILIKKYNISESEAHRKIQKQSMNQGIPIKEIVNAIIKNHNDT